MSLKQTDIAEQVTEQIIREFCEEKKVYGYARDGGRFVINDEYNDIIWINSGFGGNNSAAKGYAEDLGDMECRYLYRIKNMELWIGGFTY